MAVNYEGDSEQEQMEKLFQLEKWRNDMQEYFGEQANDANLDALLDQMLPALRQELSSGRKTLMSYPAVMIRYAQRGVDWTFMLEYCEKVHAGEITRHVFGDK